MPMMLMLLVTLMGVGMGACSKDDKEPEHYERPDYPSNPSDPDDPSDSSSEQLLIGKWMYTEVREEYEVYVIWEFKSNGRITEEFIEGDEHEKYVGHWYVAGNKLFIQWDDDPDEINILDFVVTKSIFKFRSKYDPEWVTFERI